MAEHPVWNGAAAQLVGESILETAREARAAERARWEKLVETLVEALDAADAHFALLYPHGAEDGDYLCSIVRSALTAAREQMGPK